MAERDVMLNELAQGLRPMSQGIEWFDALGPEEQSETLRFLSTASRLAPPPKTDRIASAVPGCARRTRPQY